MEKIISSYKYIQKKIEKLQYLFMLKTLSKIGVCFYK